MAPNETTTTDELADDRLEAVETITIDWAEFKKALKLDYLAPINRSRHNVLRLTPPFETEMTATYYESQQGTYYPPEMDPKPLHIRPHAIIQEGRDRGFRDLINWPTKASVRDVLREEEIQDSGGIEAALDESRAIYWEELRHSLPDSFRYHTTAGRAYELSIEWEGLDD